MRESISATISVHAISISMIKISRLRGVVVPIEEVGVVGAEQLPKVVEVVEVAMSAEAGAVEGAEAADAVVEMLAQMLVVKLVSQKRVSMVHLLRDKT